MMSDSRSLERYSTLDDRKIEALLANMRAPCTAQQLATAVGWTLPRTTAALDRLEARLASTGQTLQRLGHQTYVLAPRSCILDPAQIARCARNHSKRIDLVTAGVLHRALTHPDPERARDRLQSAAEHAAADWLITAGVLEKRSGALRPTGRTESTFGIRSRQ